MVDVQNARSGLRERKKDKTRTALLEAALRLFAQQGFAETTINQIAAEVDVSARTLLRYFPTKEDIVVSQVEDSMAVFRTAFSLHCTDHSVRAALLASARALLDHYETQTDFYLAIERAIAASPEIRARKLGLSAELVDELATLASKCSDEQTQAVWQARLHTEIVFSIVRAVIGRWVEADGKPSLGTLFDEALRLTGIAQT